MSEFKKDFEDYFCKFTFGQFVSLILLELVTLFFVFYLGARFGPDLIAPRQEIAEKKEAGDGERFDKPREVSLSYPELLTEKGEGAIRVKPSGMTAREMDEREQPVVVPLEEKGPPVPIPAEKFSEGPPVAVAPKPEVVEPGAKGKYSIQVGSYQSSDEAAVQMEKWRGKGYSTFMTVGELANKGTWYRVRIGHFSNQEEAKKFLKNFKGKEKTNALVVSSKN
ncbi:MAG: SPOR domain-containing protein [Deltaproteobacteria bacterium]|nr:SPOR domain-containing protein [Deltaproteobacteria bacterium]